MANLITGMVGMETVKEMVWRYLLWSFYGETRLEIAWDFLKKRCKIRLKKNFNLNPINPGLLALELTLGEVFSTPPRHKTRTT